MTTTGHTLAALSWLNEAERKIRGARYDLTRDDKHPNDTHKALTKIEEASGALTQAARDLR